MVKGWTGDYSLGFVFLSVFCQVCLAINFLVFLRGRAAAPAAQAGSAAPAMPEAGSPTAGTA
jgi:hypothetical protein